MKINRSLTGIAGILNLLFLFQSNPGFAQITVSVTPGQTDVTANQTHQFVATVLGTTNQNVTWSVIHDGVSRVGPGVVDSTGLYTAPSTPPTPEFVTIKATSVADPSAVGTATVLVRGLHNYTTNNIDEDFYAKIAGDVVIFRWKNLPTGTAKIIFSRAPYGQGGWTEVLVDEFPMDMTALGDAMYTAKESTPPDTANDYLYKMEAFSSSGQLLKSYAPVFLPKSVF